MRAEFFWEMIKNQDYKDFILIYAIKMWIDIDRNKNIKTSL
jgi:hypothetical protein